MQRRNMACVTSERWGCESQRVSRNTRHMLTCMRDLVSHLTEDEQRRFARPPQLVLGEMVTESVSVGHKGATDKDP